jgi:hypothetical protein
MPLTPAQVEAIVSADRFARYVQWAGNPNDAIGLYTLNTALSECLYTPIQVLEVTLRNRMNAVLSGTHGAGWVLGSGPFLNDYQRRQITEASDRVQSEGKAVTAPRVIAALSFGFWSSLVGRNQEQLWRAELHAIARKPDGRGCSRKELSAPLDNVRHVRNRIAHHEPILHLDLPALHTEIGTLTGWLDPNAAAWVTELSRFAVVFPQGGIVLLPPPNPNAAP